MTYDQVFVGASIASMLICISVFLGALWYALRPDRRGNYDRAARLPLED